jgi:hypothetical protein
MIDLAIGPSQIAKIKFNAIVQAATACPGAMISWRRNRPQ